MMRPVFLIPALALATSLSLAQTPSPIPQPAPPAASSKPITFDVISIKPNNGGTTVNNQGMFRSMIMLRPLPDGITASNVTARLLISSAYGIKEDQISGGPGWLASTGYDINAKVTTFDPPDSHQLTKDQRNQAIQALLADRFKLAVHTETKQATIYELTLAKGGLKIKPSDPSAAPPPLPAPPAGLPPGAAVIRPPDSAAPGAAPIPRAGTRIMMNAGQMTISGPTSMAQLADTLSRALRQTVIDKTGLTGNYDINLQFAPDTNASTDSAETSAPSIFTAVQEQLGLKLDSTKGPVQTLVIDHIEPPSEN